MVEKMDIEEVEARLNEERANNVETDMVIEPNVSNEGNDANKSNVNDHNEVKEGNENLNEEPENLGESISGLVNQDIVKQLTDMGYSKIVAEKALLLNKQVLDQALEWIYENQDQPDFEKEMRLMGKSDKPSANMTQEEIKARAKELQDYARKKHLQKEKERAEEAERNRIRMSNFLI